MEFCRRGRHALPAGDYCTIAADGHAAVSMTAAGADDYYPGAVYEGLQFWIDPDAQTDSGFLALMGLDVHGIINYFCAGGPYYCPMGDELAALVDELWREFDVSGYASRASFAMPWCGCSICCCSCLTRTRWPGIPGRRWIWCAMPRP